MHAVPGRVSRLLHNAAAAGHARWRARTLLLSVWAATREKDASALNEAVHLVCGLWENIEGAGWTTMFAPQCVGKQRVDFESHHFFAACPLWDSSAFPLTDIHLCPTPVTAMLPS